MNPTVKVPSARSCWVGLAALAAFVVVGAAACGDDDDSVEIEDPTWTVTRDPYGREWACLMVDTGSYAGGLFCAPGPESP